MGFGIWLSNTKEKYKSPLVVEPDSTSPKGSLLLKVIFNGDDLNLLQMSSIPPIAGQDSWHMCYDLKSNTGIDLEIVGDDSFLVDLDKSRFTAWSAK